MRPTFIIRHPKENRQKCSLRGLETRPDLRFATFPRQHDDHHPIANLDSDDLRGRVVLVLGAAPLTPADVDAGLLLIDGTWRYAARMHRALVTWAEVGPTLIPRALPQSFVTAYPRRQTDCPDPGAGLASVEALVAAYLAVGWNPAGLLDHYRWAAEFLRLNAIDSSLASDAPV